MRRSFASWNFCPLYMLQYLIVWMYSTDKYFTCIWEECECCCSWMKYYAINKQIKLIDSAVQAMDPFADFLLANFLNHGHGNTTVLNYTSLYSSVVCFFLQFSHYRLMFWFCFVRCHSLGVLLFLKRRISIFTRLLVSQKVFLFKIVFTLMQVLQWVTDYFVMPSHSADIYFQLTSMLKLILKHTYKYLHIYNELLVDNITIYSGLGILKDQDLKC